MIIQYLLRPDTDDEYGISKLQNVILNIMFQIDLLCHHYNIEYYIIGGTALGAKRHGGFIPWDDDLDIAMKREHYDRFCAICKQDLSDDFYFQEGSVDWPLYFSKVRLKGTCIDEFEKHSYVTRENQGIYVDVFPLDNVPNSKIGQIWWYFCGKSLVANSLLRRGYLGASFIKRIIMLLSSPLCIEPIRRFFYRQVVKNNSIQTDYIGGFAFISRFNNTISPASIWGKPEPVLFETVSLLAPHDLEGFLTFYFGDFMQMPPIEKRAVKHFASVMYGKYE